MLYKIALRNILLHKLKTLIIGGIIIFGTSLAIIGNSLVDAISSGMKNNLVASVTGDIQIYSKNAKEKLSIFGNIDGNMPDISHVNDFQRIKKILLSNVKNIKSIIPMGTNMAMLSPGNILDVKLEELRRKKSLSEYPDLLAHVKSIVNDIAVGFINNPGNMKFLKANKDYADAPENLHRANSEEFWENFDKDIEGNIEFLGNKIAPLIFDDNMLFFSYIGTEPTLFKQNFALFEIVKGEAIPEGKRGFLFSDSVYENMVKHRIARKLDFIKKKRDKEKQKIANEKDLLDRIQTCKDQAAEIYSQMTPKNIDILKPKLNTLLESKENDFRKLIVNFLEINDNNFEERYRFFYDEIAPYIVLYKVKIGEIFPVNAFTKTGFTSSLNLKLYGTFRYKSFESSPIAGNFSLMDIISFRELYGFMTEERKLETKQLEQEMNQTDLGQEDMESLFSQKTDLVSEKKNNQNLDKQIQIKAMVKGDLSEQVYSLDEMENGVFLNAAIILHDPSKLRDTIKSINELSSKENLDIQAVDWREAAGIVGQLTVVVRGLLFLSLMIIFIVASFVMTNSILMATLERTKEIGTMRAIGAQKRFILSLLLHETFFISFTFGLIGTLIGSTVIGVLGKVGIPAMGDVSTFFFSGDRLYPNLNLMHILIVFISMTLLAILATQYPAWKAMKISPLEAMQKRE